MTFPFIFLHELTEHMKAFSIRPVNITVTDNRVTMISSQSRLSRIDLRVHWMFLEAPENVWNALGHYLGNPGKKHRKTIRDYIAAFPLPQKKARPRKTLLKPEGCHVDLRNIFREVNGEYFENRITSAITFGNRNRRRRRVRYLHLGYYCRSNNTITISSRLDRKDIPEEYIRYIVYHEMLHADQKESVAGERRRIHDREFRRKEKNFKDYELIKKIHHAIIEKL